MSIHYDILGNENLATVDSLKGLMEVIDIPPAARKSVSPKLMATIVEAILGAVSIDGGTRALGAVMTRLGLTQHPLLTPVSGLQE